jgi:hypothetical protein
MNINLSVERWWNDTDGGESKYADKKKPSSGSTSYIKNPTRTGVNSNPGLCVAFLLRNNRASLFAVHSMTMSVIQIIYCRITVSGRAVVSQPRPEPETSWISQKYHHLNQITQWW